MKDIEKEIQIVENIIRLLKDCLAISLKNKRKAEGKSTIKDIQRCEEELKRLIGIKAAKQNQDTTKEPAKGNAAV